MAAPIRKIIIETHDFGDYTGPDFPTVISKAIKDFADYEKDTFAIDLIQVDGYYLHENSVEQIQMDIEDKARKLRADKEKPSKD